MLHIFFEDQLIPEINENVVDEFKEWRATFKEMN